MARAHAASACVQSDSIKGLAQSIAKPAYHRLSDSGARASPRRADPDHRLPDHHLPRRLRPGGRPEPAEARRDEARPRRGRRCARRAHRPHRLDPAGSRRHLRAPADYCCPASSRPGASPPAGTSSSPAPTSACSPACRSTAALGDTAGILDVISAALPLTAPGQPGRRHRHHPAQRRRRAGDPAHRQIAARPGHRHPGKDRSTLGIGRRAVGDAVRHHRLRRADPRLCLPLAIDPRPRRRPHQRRGARPHRYRAQSRPLRIVGLGPVARPDLLVAIDVHHARARQPQRPPDLRRGQRAGEIRRHRSVRDRRPADLRRRSTTSTRPSACSTPTATGSGCGCAASSARAPATPACI